jgi:hypothetical protein
LKSVADQAKLLI